VAQALGSAFTVGCAGLGLHLDLHDLPKHTKQGLAEEVELATFSQLAEELLRGDNGIGHRGVLLHRYGFVANTYENTRWLSSSWKSSS
jgi:hypothetical protein